MFLNIDKVLPDKIAMIDDEGSSTYGELVSFCREYMNYIPRRCLIFILCEHAAAAVETIAASVENHIVPLLLGHDTDHDLVMNFIELYKPAYLWVPDRLAGKFDYEVTARRRTYTLLKTGFPPYELYEDLSLLLATSGSTGSPKLVRHSYGNLDATAVNVAQSFGLSDDERAMISLPINFTQGLSTVTSNLLCGGTLLLTKASLVQKPFWNMMKEQKATSFTGVPYSFEILNKLRFFKMDLPDLRLVNQGGGRLTDDMFKALASYAEENNKRFIASYGSTETTSRMACLPPSLAMTKTGSIGRAIANGNIIIADDNGCEVTEPNALGEIIYSGKNVTLGYGESPADLLKGDERGGVYHTGDLAYKDEDGCIFIVGRKTRFLKLFGYRIGLDETERLLRSSFDAEFACVGTDKKMIVYTTKSLPEKEVINFLQSKTGINGQAFAVRIIDALPKNPTGKTLYSKLENT